LGKTVFEFAQNHFKARPTLLEANSGQTQNVTKFNPIAAASFFCRESVLMRV
jgi:hypothetical protein